MRAAREIYPQWSVRFYLDKTVPPVVVAGLQELGAEIVSKPSGMPVFKKLAWRFEVADDPTVARFLVRDVDSVVSLRERAAVDAWIASDRWFHVMRDWWVHSSLVLAGMWGGVANVLPPVKKMVDRYSPRHAAAAAADQDFLRERLWPYLSTSSLVHDRCFDIDGVNRWPEPDPHGDDHVGINAFAAEPDAQAARVASFIRDNLSQQLPCLEALGL